MTKNFDIIIDRKNLILLKSSDKPGTEMVGHWTPLNVLWDTSIVTPTFQRKGESRSHFQGPV